MSDPDLLDPIHRAQRDEERAAVEKKRGLGATLALIGTLGWMIVLPPLGGLFLGRWLDRNGDGAFWTLSLLFTGVAVGCWTAWHRVMGGGDDTR
jgi:ATP synthase protein I